MRSTDIIAFRNAARNLSPLVMLVTLSFFYTVQAQAGQATLAWDPNIQSILGGYKLYYGQASGTYTASKDVGNETSYTLTDLLDGKKYYFAVKAYSILGLIGGMIESGFSNEVSATIPSPPTVPTAGFNANPTSGTAPLTVTFTDTSTGNMTAWSWSFGDGTTSTAKNAAKTYTDPGSYTVRLTVTDTAGSSDTATKIISVAAPGAAPVANFSASPTSGPPPLAVTFTNNSTNATSYSWDFNGNGTTDSTEQNPSHTYNTLGTYTVSLTATGPGGANTKNGYITVSLNSGGSGGNDAGLVGAYDFEEASGTSVDDASGQDNTGTINGATRITQGHSGKALSFDGVNDWVTIDDSASLDLTSGMTLEAWVYPTVDMTDWVDVVIKEATNGAAYYLVANSDKNQAASGVTIGGEQILRGGPWLLANTWTHLAATYDGTTQRLYVNGTQVAQRPQTGPIQVSSSPLRLGGNSVWGEYFEGRIDEVRVYNRALSADEVYLAGTGTNDPITIGETSILSVTDSGNGNLLIAQPDTLSQTATIQSLSFYVTTASGNLRLGIYDATGPGGGPGAKKAETGSITPTTGWNTANVITPVSLPAGTYWLAYLASSSSLKFKAESTGGNSKLYPFTFGTMPVTFSTAPGPSAWRWSLYATLAPNP